MQRLFASPATQALQVEGSGLQALDEQNVRVDLTLTNQQNLPSHWPQATLTLRRAGRTMRFVLIRTSGLAALQPDEADWVAEWASAGSPKLAVGQPLDWTTLPETGTVVLTLAD